MMKGKKILISVDGDEGRIALINDGVLENLHIELAQKGRIVGNIYKGIVTNIQSAFQAAFIDYGAERKGFLSVNDVNSTLFKPTYSKSSHGKPPIQTLLKHGQSIMVQVTKEEIGHKGAALTTNISLPGRFLVFMPNSDKGGISKKIECEEQRSRLKDLIKGLENENAAIIIRTAGIDRSLVELKKDYRSLLTQWRKIQGKFNRIAHPGLIYEERNMVVRTLRDYFTSDIKEVLINNADAFQKALDLFKEVIPRQQRKLRLFVGDEPLFSAYGIEKQIEELSVNKVSLKSGGSIIIDKTEALVSIDVNSGTSKQENKIEETALRTNLEAAEAIARHLCLRNLGGLIVIDFIDMSLQKNKKKVVDKLKECLASDKAKCVVDTISQFGLLEMSRQRIGAELSYKAETVCPTCKGSGTIASVITSANIILRKIREMAAKGNLLEVRGELPVELANHLLNEKRIYLRDLELEYDITILLTASSSLNPGQIPELEIKTIASSSVEIEPEIKETIIQRKDNHKSYHKRRDNGKKESEKKYSSQDSIKLAQDEHQPTMKESVVSIGSVKPESNKEIEKEDEKEKDKEDRSLETMDDKKAVKNTARTRARSWFRARFKSRRLKVEEETKPMAEIVPLNKKDIESPPLIEGDKKLPPQEDTLLEQHNELSG